MIERIQNLIRELAGISHRSGRLPQEQRLRVEALTRDLEEALHHRDFARCATRIASEIHHANPSFYPGFDFPKLPENPASRTDSTYREILSRQFEQILRAKRFPTWCRSLQSEPGTAIIHRIWLGADIGDDRLRRIAACNMRLAKCWKHPESGGSIQPESIIWTDSRNRLSSPPSWGIRFRDYRELLDRDNVPFSPFVSEFILKKEHAFAADILRILALHRLGGFHLGIDWHPELEDRSPPRPFAPHTHSLHVFFLDFEEETIHSYPFAIENEDVIFRWSEFQSHFHMDTELLYIGHPNATVLNDLRSTLLRLLETLNRNPGYDPVFHHRRSKYQLHRQSLFTDSWATPDGEILSFTEVVRATLFKDKRRNIGQVTNTFPLRNALLRTGRIPVSDSRYPTRVWDPPEDWKFRVKIEFGQDIFLNPAFGIERDLSQSWLRIPLDYRPHFED